MKRLFGFIVALGLVFGYQYYNKNSASSEMHEALAKVIQTIPEYESEKTYLDACFDEAHLVAFDASYSSGSRRKSASFDYPKYLSILFAKMISKAETDKHPQLISSLATTRDIALKSAVES